MTAKKINPDSAMLQQADGNWMKFAALIVWKLAGRGSITITTADIEGMHTEFAPNGPILLTHGHADSIEFRLVEPETARRIAEFDATQRGHA